MTIFVVMENHLDEGRKSLATHLWRGEDDTRSDDFHLPDRAVTMNVPVWCNLSRRPPLSPFVSVLCAIGIVVPGMNTPAIIAVPVAVGVAF